MPLPSNEFYQSPFDGRWVDVNEAKFSASSTCNEKDFSELAGRRCLWMANATGSN